MTPLAFNKEYPLFMRLCWLLNDLHLYGLAGWLRKWVWLHVDGNIEVTLYMQPLDVGYSGWVEMDGYGVLAFIPLDNFSEWQFVW